MWAPVLSQCPSAPSCRFLRKVSLPRTPFGPHGSLRAIGTLGRATRCYAQAQALFTQVRRRVILRSWSVRRPLRFRYALLLSATQDSARNQKRVRRAYRRHQRNSDEHPEARVASTTLLAAHDLAVVGGARHPRLGLHHR